MDLFHLQRKLQGLFFGMLRVGLCFRVSKITCANGKAAQDTLKLTLLILWNAAFGNNPAIGRNLVRICSLLKQEDRIFALKPMNCPGGVQVYKQGIKSYRDLPQRIAEFGKVHRFEPSGALHGLMRVRAFTQDDAHIFCTEEQITEECCTVCQLILDIYRDFGFTDVRIKFSDRPAKRIGSDEIWDKSEAALIAAVKTTGLVCVTNPGEGAFYGPKLEFVLRDAIGRDWQCGTLQVDLNLPDRLGATYIGADGEKHTPVMLHRALFGSLERFTGILLEHYAGNLPLWLAPVQIVIATITSDANEYADKILKMCEANGLRVGFDIRNEKINYKIT